MRDSNGYHNKLPDLTVSPVVHLSTLGPLVGKISRFCTQTHTHTHTRMFSLDLCPTSILDLPSHLVWFDILRQSHNDIYTCTGCWCCNFAALYIPWCNSITHAHTVKTPFVAIRFTAWIGKCTEQQSIYIQLAPFMPLSLCFLVLVPPKIVYIPSFPCLLFLP